MIRQSVPAILLTRPEDAARRFKALLRADGITVPILMAPLLRLCWRELPEFDPGAGVLITSRALAERLGADLVSGREAYCVGGGTAEVLAEKGARVVAMRPTAAALADVLADVPPASALIWLHGPEITHDFRSDPCLAGLRSRLQSIRAYDRTGCAVSAEAHAGIKAHTPMFVPVFSADSARRLVSSWPDDAAPPHVLALSRACAAPLPTHWPLPTIATRPDGAAMRDLLRAMLEPWERQRP